MTERMLDTIRRAGKDPVQFDPRPLSEIMNDEIPYEKWERQQRVLTRAGYHSWEDALRAKFDAKGPDERARKRNYGKS